MTVVVYLNFFMNICINVCKIMYYFNLLIRDVHALQAGAAVLSYIHIPHAEALLECCIVLIST